MTRADPSLLVRLVVIAAVCLSALACSDVLEPTGHPTFASPQSNPIALSEGGHNLYVANTTSNSVSVIDTRTLETLAEIPVGLEPVGLAVRPNVRELWVANHVSDSISVIDIDHDSPNRFQTIATIQDFAPDGTTRFDEPVAIAFANEGKAYVSLSSRNDIAVIDAWTHTITGHIHIPAQEPRAIAVRRGLLFVAAFESNNKSELSVCPEALAIDAPQCTLLAEEVGTFVVEPNLPGEDVRIVEDPDVPDGDLFVISIETDQIVDVVEGVGTLLYGVVAGPNGEVFVTQTDARNALNGTPGENLPFLENRMFENQITRVACPRGVCGAPERIALDPALPNRAGPAEALATPYGIAISGNDEILVVTAAGTSRLFSMNATTGRVLDRIDLGPDPGQQIPRGVALFSDWRGDPQTAYVLNTLENTVSIVDVSDPENLVQVGKVPVGQDPTPDDIRLGRIAFNNAFASTSANFSCASCHPDGNTDQLLWRIGGACFFGACSGDDEVRSTMPVRGLRDTLPLHWDGSLGDPFGGVNGAVGPNVTIAPSCSGEQGCFRHLVDASLSGVMCDQDGGCDAGPSGLPGLLDETEREHMARFLANVSYPPARERLPDDSLTPTAAQGFSDFFINKGGIAAVGGIDSCGDANNGCHNLPLMAGTNNVTLQGFDAPTLRGLNDRFLQFSIGISNAEESLRAARTGGPLPFIGLILDAPGSPLPWDPANGFEEAVTFAASFNAFDPLYNVGPLNIFKMLNEMSTGFAAVAGRQVTLNTTSAGALRAQTEAALDLLEAADAKGVVVLQGVGHARVLSGEGDLGEAVAAMVPAHLLEKPMQFRFDSASGQYLQSHGAPLARATLLDRTASGEWVVTLTAHLPARQTVDQPQPLLSTLVLGRGATTGNNPDIPFLPAANPFLARGRHVEAGAVLFVDGQPTMGTIECDGGSFSPTCDSEVVRIELATLPTGPGIHVLQVQNPGGLLSNELPMCNGTVRRDCF